ncbi:hypothetical protein KI387_044027, partial [Taxus chinensis]
IGKDLDHLAGRGAAERVRLETMDSLKQAKSKAAEDIIEAVKIEKMGFPDKEVHLAIYALIE